MRFSFDFGCNRLAAASISDSESEFQEFEILFGLIKSAHRTSCNTGEQVLFILRIQFERIEARTPSTLLGVPASEPITRHRMEQVAKSTKICT